MWKPAYFGSIVRGEREILATTLILEVELSVVVVFEEHWNKLAPLAKE